MSNETYLRELMKRYTTDHLVGITPEEFKAKIDGFLAMEDHKMEGFDIPDAQRNLSIKFHWGHNHDFGTFKLEGQAGDRHIKILSKFIEMGLPKELSGSKILDIGVWTGGTSLLLVAMEGNVTAFEEVHKYAAVARLLADSFDLPELTVKAMSLYTDDVSMYYNNLADYIVCAGVFYHLTDPILALRIFFNCLKDGGKIFFESAKAPNEYEGAHILTYEGPSKPGWNWFLPTTATLKQMMTDVGFESVEVEPVKNRMYAVATRKQHKPMLQAGISKRIL